MFKILCRFIFTFFLSLSFVLFWRCTENPFDDDRFIANNIISGKVELIDQLNPNDVYIWFKALDIGTRTDEDGSFNLVLPSPFKQPGGGIDGIYYIYFYVANYNLDSVGVAIRNGNLNITNEEMNNDGELKRVVKLSKLLDIKTSTEPRSILSNSFNDTVFTKVTLQAYDINNTLTVVGYYSRPIDKGDPIFLAGILLDSNKNFVKVAKREDRGLVNHTFQIGAVSGEITPMILKYEPGMLSPGIYEIIPCLLIRQKLPPGLLKSIGENVESLSREYLKVPLIIRGSQFHVFE